MTDTRITSLVCSAALVLSFDATAQTSNDLRRKCNAPADGTATRLDVDAARTGQRIDAHYPHARHVEILIENKNPYKYRYRTTFSQGPLPANVNASLISTLYRVPEIPAQRSSRVRSMTSASTVLEELRTEVIALNDGIENYNTFVAKIGADMIECKSVADNATLLLPHLAKLRDVSDIRNKVDRLLAMAREQSSGAPNALVSDSEALATALSAIEHRAPDFDSLWSRLLEIGAAESPFSELVRVNGLGRRTSTTVEIYRTNLLQPKSAEELVASVRLDVGAVPLSVSAGIGFSTVNEVELSRQASSDGMGGIVNRFGFGSKSEFRPTGLVMLNGHALTKPSFTFGPSAAVVIGQRGEETQLEYLLGASIGLRDDLIWLTFGLHAAKVANLSGFSIGDVVPESLQDPIPTEESFGTGFMFAVTFKVR